MVLVAIFLNACAYDLLEDVAVFLTKEDLVDVLAGPGVHYILHDLLSFFFSHFETNVNRRFSHSFFINY